MKKIIGLGNLGIFFFAPKFFFSAPKTAPYDPLTTHMFVNSVIVEYLIEL